MPLTLTEKLDSRKWYTRPRPRGGENASVEMLYILTFYLPRFLDHSYNVLKRLYHFHPNLFRWEEIKVLHYVGRKPWESVLVGDGRYAALEKIWFSFVTPAS